MEIYDPIKEKTNKWDVYLNLKAGRAGNMLFQVAAVYAVCKLKRARGVSREYDELKKDIFPNMALKIYPKHKWQESIKHTKRELVRIPGIAFVPKLIKSGPINSHMILHCYCQSYKYFEGMEQEIRQISQFSETLKEHAKAIFINILSSLTEVPSNVTFVGIHVRRSDVVNDTQVNIPSLSYFIKSMNYFKTEYKGLHVLFVIASDDIEWCMHNLNMTMCILSMEADFRTWLF